jgi:hypothetical protein
MTYTSTISTTAINENYPVAGLDNNTDGFRTNFTAIKAALIVAGNEIQNISNRAVLTSAMNTPYGVVENDLGASKIINGTYKKFYSIARTSSLVSGSSITVDLTTGNLHKFLVNLDTAITVTGWPAAGQYASVRIHLKFLPDAEAPLRTVSDVLSIGGTNNAAVYKEAYFIFPHVTGNSEFVIDVWSYDGGNSLFVKYVGEFNMIG